MLANDLKDQQFYRVTRDVLNTWTEGDLFRCDRTTSITRLIIVRYKKTNARSLNAANPDFRHVVDTLVESES